RSTIWKSAPGLAMRATFIVALATVVVVAIFISCEIRLSWQGAVLTKRERKGLDAGIEEFNLKDHVFDGPLLPDELIHPRLSNLARSIGAGIGSMIVAGHGAIQLHLEANRRPALRRAQDHMDVAAVEPEHNLAGRRCECATLGPGVPRSAESPLI